jgi:hypothetical protein
MAKNMVRHNSMKTLLYFVYFIPGESAKERLQNAE